MMSEGTLICPAGALRHPSATAGTSRNESLFMSSPVEGEADAEPHAAEIVVGELGRKHVLDAGHRRQAPLEVEVEPGLAVGGVPLVAGEHAAELAVPPQLRAVQARLAHVPGEVAAAHDGVDRGLAAARRAGGEEAALDAEEQ